MHKLVDYICEELETLERKADKDGKLSMAEVQYMDTLAHAKKNLLKAEEMSEDDYSNGYDMGYSRRGYSRRGSYATRKRDSMGRYSRDGYGRNGYSMAGDEMIDELRELMEDAPDEKTKAEFRKFISRMESM